MRLENIQTDLVRDVYEDTFELAKQLTNKAALHRHTFVSLELHCVLMQAQKQHCDVQRYILQLKVQEEYLRTRMQKRVNQDAQGSPTMLQLPVLQVLLMQEANLFEHIILQLCEMGWQQNQWQTDVDDLDDLHSRRTTVLYANTQKQTLLECGVEKQEIKLQLSFVQEASRHAHTLHAVVQKSIDMARAVCVARHEQTETQSQVGQFEHHLRTWQEAVGLCAFLKVSAIRADEHTRN